MLRRSRDRPGFREESRRKWAEWTRIRHTKTLHMRSDDIQAMETWLAANTQRRWTVKISPTKQAQVTGLHSVVVYLDDDALWVQFTLTWL